MPDFIDRAILIVMGLEKKVKGVMDELADEGRTEVDGAEGDAAEGEDLPLHKKAENKIVEEGVKALQELRGVLREGKERFEKEVIKNASALVETLNVATRSELDTVKEMARVAREKVDALEKKIKDFEKKKKKK